MKPGTVLCICLLVVAFPFAGPLNADDTVSREISVCFQDVPTREVLQALADRLSLTVEARSVTPANVTMALDGTPAEVLLDLLAWQGGETWYVRDGVLHWGSLGELSPDELNRYRKTRQPVLQRRDQILGRRLSEPLPFKMELRRARACDVFLFLQREAHLPVFLDSRCRSCLQQRLSVTLDRQPIEEFLRTLTSSADDGSGLAWMKYGGVVVVSSPASLSRLAASQL